MSLRNYKTLIPTITAAIAVACILCLQQYSSRTAEAETHVQQATPAAKPVHFEIVRTHPVQIWKKFSTRLEAVDYAQIRPQVSGTITEIRFNDGQLVLKGQVLYVIDPRPFKAAVKRARSELETARTNSTFAQKEFERAAQLIKTNIVSRQYYDQRSNSAAVLQSMFQAAEARLKQAEIDLDRAYVKAPISGRISRAEIKIGNLVSAGTNAPILTSIVSNNGIFADFEVDENTYLEDIRPAARTNMKEKTIPVKLNIGNGRQHYEGFVHSFDNRIDASSGTIRARAFFANKNNDLLPGMFGSVQLGSAVQQNHILISETAIGTNQDRKFVYVVDDNNTAQYREVQLGNIVGGKRIVTAGLKNGDRVISTGLMRIRPGMLVSPKDRVATSELSIQQKS